MRLIPMLLLAATALSTRLEAATVTATAPAPGASAASRPTTSSPALPGASLRLARSTDGLVFKDTGELLLENASAPALARLPNGHLLLLCDREMGVEGPTLLVVSQSADEGRSWTPPRPTRMEGARTLPGRHGAFVWMPDGLLRLYYVAGVVDRAKEEKHRGAAATQPLGQTRVLSAVTRDGLRYKHDRSMGLAFDEGADLHVTAAQVADRIHLFVDRPDSWAGTRSAGATHLVSKEGQRFERAGAVQASGICFVGAVVATDSGLRAYVTGGDGVRSLVSEDGSKWKTEEGVRLAGGADPAVARLKDGTYLMVYDWRMGAKGGGLSVITSQTVDTKGLGKLGESNGGASSAGAVTFEPFAAESASSGTLPDLKPAAGSAERNSNDASGQSPGAAQQTAEDSFPPKPDFSTPVNYLEWFQQYYPGEVENNALDAYDAFMPHQRYPYQERPGFPGEINDMFNSEYSGPIIPWDPTQHPDWEATHNSMPGLLEQFRQATHYEHYACPLMPWVDAELTPDGVQPLYSLMLPSLAVHRAMTKSTMADAWRAENGVVDPARMVDAFETCLRSANHMEQGYTLIHHLVGFAHQALAERNALKALQHNVFTTPAQIESALNTLQQYDHYDSRATTWLPLEHASALDSVQYLYPPDDNGQPRLNRERAAVFMRSYMMNYGSMSKVEVDETVRAKMDAYSKLTVEEVRQSVDALDLYFHQLREKWQAGYPQVREKDIDDLRNGAISSSVLVQDTTPMLGRAYHQVGRSEAMRRATQLSYEVHLFKARNGRWPASLDELPAKPGSNSHIDPFSGGRFGYKMTENGPTIYTAGEDGEDNGGIHSENIRDNGKDYIFWPPQK